MTPSSARELVERYLPNKPSGLILDFNKGYDMALRHCKEDLQKTIEMGLLVECPRVEDVKGAIRTALTFPENDAFIAFQGFGISKGKLMELIAKAIVNFLKGREYD